MSTDIVARLLLNSQNFTSENARAFADMKQRAASTAQEVRGTFFSSLTDVQRMAKQALTMPRTANGGLDLSGEIAQLKERARAADEQVAVFRKLEDSFQRIAFAEGVVTENELQRADAARVNMRLAEEDASASRTRIIALEKLQTELDGATSATNRHNVALEKAAATRALMIEQYRGEAAAARQAQEAGRFQGAIASIDEGRLSGKSARVSADVFAEQERLVTIAGRLREQLDPVATMQARVNAELLEARTAFAAAGAAAGELARAEAMIVARGDQAIASLERQMAAQRSQIDLYREQAAEARAAVEADRFQSAIRSVDDGRLSGKRASVSADVFVEQERLIVLATRLRAELDPLAAVQDRVNAELREARLAFAAAGAGADELARAEAMIVARGAEAEKSIQRQIAVQKMLGAGTSQQRQSMVMAGQQAQDFFVQVGSGQSVLTAFVQQIGQAAFAVQGMGGKMEKLANFLTSFGGIATTVAVVALTPLLAKLLAGNNALDDQIEKLRDDAQQSRITAEAQVFFGNTVEGVSKAIRDQRDALDKQIAAERGAAEQANILAKNKLEQAVAIREATKASLEAAQAELEINRVRSQAPGQRGENATFALGQSSRRTASLQAQLSQVDADLATARQNLTDTRARLAVEAGKRNADPVARLNRQYDDEVSAAERAARGNDRLTASLVRQTEQIERRRQAAIKAAQDEQKKTRTPSLGSQITGEQASSTLAAAQRYLGARENTTGGKASLRDLFSTAGMSIDPEKVAWCAAFVNAVLAGQGVKGTGSLAARSFLNFGTATSRPQNGDIVVLKRGTGDQGHVGFYAGTDQRGRVMVTGGNQGNAVSTQGFARSDVLGFRRAPTASADYAASLREQAKATREAEQAQKDLERSLDQLSDRYDPLTAAARQYREEVTEIAKLMAAGRIGQGEGFEYMMRAGRGMRDAQSRAANDNAREVLGPGLDTALADLERGIESVGDLWREEVVGGANLAVEKLRAGVDNIASVFGIRISGPVSNLLAPGGYEARSGEIASQLIGALKTSGIPIKPESLDKLEAKISDAFTGAQYGQLGASAFSSITGGKQNPLGAAVGGALGKSLGKDAGKMIAESVGGTLGKTLGSAAGPLGAIAGGILGSVVGGLFTKAKFGTSSIGFSDGALSGGSASGNSKTAQAASSAAASTIAKNVNAIVEQLGATITGAPNVTIGTYKDNYRVSTTGFTGKLNFKGTSANGLVDFGQDQQAAIAFATKQVLAGSIIKGISQASVNIIKSGQDLETAITKAGLIEAVPRDLKAMLDPVGAAVDDLNRKFQKTVDALKEGGASAEQLAQAQRLYDLQLAQVKASTASASQGLKDFLVDLKIGGNSPYSLRDQEATALAQLKPYLDTINAGGRVDQDKYQAAAKAYLDVERQLYGSTQAYFEQLDAIQAATNKAIASIDNAVPITTSVESPFAKATADSAAKTATNTQTGNELLDQLSGQIEDVKALLAELAAGGSGGGFIGSGRKFASAA